MRLNLGFPFSLKCNADPLSGLLWLNISLFKPLENFFLLREVTNVAAKAIEESGSKSNRRIGQLKGGKE